MFAKVQLSAGMLFPEPVPVELAGRSFLVSELRVRDVGAIEREVAMVLGHPLVGLEDDVAACESLPFSDPARRRSQARLLAAVGNWPPRYGSDEFREVAATAEGACTYLFILLRRHRPGLSPAGCVELAGSMTAAEWRGVDDVAWGRQPWEADGDDAGRNRPYPMDWGKAVHRVARSLGVAPDAVGDMTWTQFVNELNRGGPRDVTFPPLPATAPAE